MYNETKMKQNMIQSMNTEEQTFIMTKM